MPPHLRMNENARILWSPPLSPTRLRQCPDDARPHHNRCIPDAEDVDGDFTSEVLITRGGNDGRYSSSRTAADGSISEQPISLPRLFVEVGVLWSYARGLSYVMST